MKKIKVVQNWLKWQELGRKLVSDLLTPPPKKKLVNVKKIKVVPNWLKWREN